MTEEKCCYHYPEDPCECQCHKQVKGIVRLGLGMNGDVIAVGDVTIDQVKAAINDGLKNIRPDKLRN